LDFSIQKQNSGTEGRKDILMDIEAALASNTKRVIWMHCASLGEFEQGRPVLEGLLKALSKLPYPTYVFFALWV